MLEHSFWSCFDCGARLHASQSRHEHGSKAALLKRVHQIDVKSFKLSIVSLGRSRDWSKLCSLLLEMDKVCVSRSALNFNTAVLACERCCQWEHVLPLLEEMQKVDVTLSVVSLRAAFSARQKSGQVEEALSLFEEMREVPIARDEASFKGLLSACEKSCHWESALAVFEEMHEERFPRSVINFCEAIMASKKGRQWQRALKLLEQMREEDAMRDVVSLSAVVSACEKEQDIGRDWALLEELRKVGVTDEVISLNADFSASQKGGQMEQRLIRFRAGISASKTIEQCQKTLVLTEKMRKPSETRSVISFIAAMSACEKGGHWEPALSLLAEMRTMSAGQDATSFNTAISACEKGGQWEQALLLLEKMCTLDITRDVISFSTSISACEKNSQWEQALSLLKEMREVGLTDMLSFNAVISACERDGQKERAHLLGREMINLNALAVAAADFFRSSPHMIIPCAQEPCTAALIWFHGLGDEAEVWASEFSSTSTHSPHLKRIHLRAPKLPQICYQGERHTTWGHYKDPHCTRVGSFDYDNDEIVFDATLKEVHGIIDQLEQQEGISSSRILVGGFSMGATTAAEIAICYPKRLAGLIMLNGWLLPGAREALKSGSFKNWPVLVSHGTDDEHVGLDCGLQAVRLLREAGATVKFEFQVNATHVESGLGEGKKFAIEFMRHIFWKK